MLGSVDWLSNAKDWVDCQTPCRQRQQTRLVESRRALQRGSLDYPIYLENTSVGALNRELRLIHREACSACDYFSAAFKAQKYLDEILQGAELQAFGCYTQRDCAGSHETVIMEVIPHLPDGCRCWKISPEPMRSSFDLSALTLQRDGDD